MGEDKTEQKGNLNNDQRMAVENMHKTFLEALRHREQEILRFMAILAPALGGFIWLLTMDLVSTHKTFVFTIGTLGVLLLLLLGAVYSLALGFNYRYIILQLAKLESCSCLGIRDFMLEEWPRKPEDFAERYEKKGRPYCIPPEIIKVFWLVFLVGIVGVSACVVCMPPMRDNWTMKVTILLFGGMCLYVALKTPSYYGRKFQRAYQKEFGKWERIKCSDLL